MKKLAFLLSLLILFGCSHKPSEERVINAILESMGETKESAEEYHITFEDINIQPAFDNVPQNNLKCMEWAEYQIWLDDAFLRNPQSRLGFSQEQLNEPTKEIRDSISAIKSRNKSQIGWEIYVTVCKKNDFLDKQKAKMRVVFDKDLKEIFILENVDDPKYQKIRNIFSSLDN